MRCQTLVGPNTENAAEHIGQGVNGVSDSVRYKVLMPFITDTVKGDGYCSDKKLAARGLMGKGSCIRPHEKRTQYRKCQEMVKLV